MEILIQVALLAIGFFMLVKGADYFVEGASSIADHFGIPQIVIGLTIVAFGTSAPEAAISISAALRGNAGITIGNVVGSNIINILIILGITALITPLAIQKTTLKYEMPFMIGITGLLLWMGWSNQQVSRMDGVILILFMIIFMLYLLKLAKKTNQDDVIAFIEEPHLAETKSSMPKLVALTIVGGILIILGSNFAVESATKMAQIFGLSERFIGLTIVALGTSLPELITSVTAGIKGKADIAIGNIVGSNIFNILFVVGSASLITPVTFAPQFAIDTTIAIAAAVLLLLCVFRKQKLTRKSGIIMLAAYCAYFVYLVS